ncbi:AMP-binding protein [Tropheryma whipplei]|uniref:AMP-binding protein n=1 Tax=Tropheryma whipplei TaxID=2039 RepID=UPI001E618779|nr:AMP-binding protein [Tropheryma whipplei]
MSQKKGVTHSSKNVGQTGQVFPGASSMTKALMRGQITLDSVKRVLEDERFAICASEEPLSCGGKIMVDDAVCLVINTSGSTASPKRVAFSSSSLMNSARACCSVLGYGQWVLCLPKQYTAGVRVLVRSILSGTKPIDISENRFSPENFIHACRRLSCSNTFTALVPTQLSALVRVAEDDKNVAKVLSGFTGVIVGGQHIARSLLERSRLLGINLFTSYGLTETFGGCVYNGLPLPGVQIQIIDGRAAIASPSLALGYLKENRQIDETGFFFDRGERWFHTNDLAVMNRGKLIIHGRIDRVINSGGMKLDLNAIETALRSLDCVEDAVLLGVKSKKWGQQFCAFIDIGDVTKADRTDCLQKINTLLSTFGRACRSGQIKLIHPIPRTFSGKPDRIALQRGLQNNI